MIIRYLDPRGKTPSIHIVPSVRSTVQECYLPWAIWSLRAFKDFYKEVIVRNPKTSVS